MDMKKFKNKLIKFAVWCKPRLLDFWGLIKEIITLIIGSAVFITFGLLGILYSIGKHIWKKDYSLSRQFTPVIRAITLATDGWACASAGELLNDTLKIPKNSPVKYGKYYDTISAITGLLRKLVKDTKFRKIVDGVLGENHCEEAITPEQKSHYLKSSTKELVL